MKCQMDQLPLCIKLSRSLFISVDEVLSELKAPVYCAIQILVDELSNRPKATVYCAICFSWWVVKWTKSHCILCYLFQLMKCWMDQKPLYCAICFSWWSVEWTKSHCVQCYPDFSWWVVKWTKSHCILCYLFQLMKCWMDQKPLYTMLFVSVDEVLNGPKATILCYFFQLMKCWMDQKPLYCAISFSWWSVEWTKTYCILCYLFQLMKCWMDQKPLCTMLYRRPNQTTRAKITPRMKLKIWWDRKRIREKLQPATCKILNILSVCTLMLQWVINPL